MNRTCFIAGLFLFLLTRGLEGQEIPIYSQSQYLLNPFLVNPAIAGSKDYSVISLSSRQHLDIIDGAPKTQMVSFYTRIPNFGRIDKDLLDRGTGFTNIGVGGLIYNDVSGPLRKIGFQGTYVYHLPLNKETISHLAFGLSFCGFMYAIDYGELNTLRDPLIEEGSQSTFVPDANFGLYYYSRNIFAGISSAQLFQTPVNWKDGRYSTTRIPRSYFLMAGYRFLVRELLMLEPSFLLQADDNNIGEFYRNYDINFRVYYRTFQIGTSYRSGKGMLFLGQYQFQNLFVGFGYEYPFSKISSYTYGNVEIMIGFNLGQGKNRFGDSRYW